MKKVKYLRNVIFVASLCAEIAWSQSSFTASVRGSITDPTGAAVPKAKVTVTEADRNVPHSVMTDEAGRYNLTALPPGRYTLHAWHERAPEVTRELAVGAQGTADLDVPFDARGYKFVQHLNKYGQPYSKGGARY